MPGSPAQFGRHKDRLTGDDIEQVYGVHPVAPVDSYVFSDISDPSTDIWFWITYKSINQERMALITKGNEYFALCYSGSMISDVAVCSDKLFLGRASKYKVLQAIRHWARRQSVL